VARARALQAAAARRQQQQQHRMALMKSLQQQWLRLLPSAQGAAKSILSLVYDMC
jgi:hypothetical protein